MFVYHTSHYSVIFQDILSRKTKRKSTCFLFHAFLEYFSLLFSSISQFPLKIIIIFLPFHSILQNTTTLVFSYLLSLSLSSHFLSCSLLLLSLDSVSYDSFFFFNLTFFLSLSPILFLFFFF